MDPEKRTPVKCAACGAKFHLTCARDQWGYAYKGRLACSYHCMRELETNDKPQSRRRLPSATYNKDRKRNAWELHEAGFTWDEVAEITGYKDARCASDSAYKYRRAMLAREAAEIAAIESGTEAVG